MRLSHLNDENECSEGPNDCDIEATAATALQQAFAELRAQVLAHVPPQRGAQALERIDELEEAITAAEPDVTTM